MALYDAFSQTFSNSRKDLHWPELEYIIQDMKEHGVSSVLDIGCGNGRFVAECEKYGLNLKVYLGIDDSVGMISEARSLHPARHFEVCPMESLASCEVGTMQYECILFLASFHHLETREARVETLQQAKKLVTPNGRIYMTNWNLRDQPKYTKNHRGNGDFDIKIGEYTRYYHGFTLDELGELYDEVGLAVKEHRIFDGGRNILSILTLPTTEMPTGG